MTLPQRRMNELIPDAFDEIAYDHDINLYRYFRECFDEWYTLKISENWKVDLYLSDTEYRDLIEFCKEKYAEHCKTIVEELAHQDWEGMGIDHMMSEEEE